MEEASASNEASTSSDANANAAVAARRSQRKRRVGDAESEQPEESNHPLANAKDASVYSLQSLLMLQSRNANYFNKLDFVYLSDDAIEQLFVTDRARNQLGDRILYPPLALRRTSAQIREFYRGGSRQCQQLIDKYANYKINARLQTIPEEEEEELLSLGARSK